MKNKNEIREEEMQQRMQKKIDALHKKRNNPSKETGRTIPGKMLNIKYVDKVNDFENYLNDIISNVAEEDDDALQENVNSIIAMYKEALEGS